MSWKDAMAALYASLDAEIGALGGVCTGCGACCAFASYGHQLWVSSVEAAYLIAVHGAPADSVGDRCPYLVAGRCTARVGRAIGCRVFFCNLDDARMNAVTQRFLDRAAQIAARWNLRWEYGEFFSMLTAASRRALPETTSDPLELPPFDRSETADR